jgi:hypothetical protein
MLFSLLIAGGVGAADLRAPVRIEASGRAIDVEHGHAAPLFADLDGDGLEDLLVGQFGGGKLRVYKNVGFRGAPRFDEFKWFTADGSEGTIPSA